MQKANSHDSYQRFEPQIIDPSMDLEPLPEGSADQPGFNRLLETVRNAKSRDKRCCLLIGAGCSKTAGVPLASEFVELIKIKWPSAYKDAVKPKDYQNCMAELAPAARRELTSEYVEKAKINWSHVGIAQLMKAGFVDRVLTTNFDPLVVRACAMVGLFPAVYDFAASQVLKPAEIQGPAVFYLHGQSHGFFQLSTNSETTAQSQKLGPLFSDAGSGRVWIVVGYSGRNDPVFRLLEEVESFDNNLFWVSRDREPEAHVAAKLLSEGKNTFFLKDFDADDFFVTVAQKLQCFPPDFIQDPLLHSLKMLELLALYKPPQQKQTEAIDITDSAREKILRCKNSQSGISECSRILNAYLTGDFEQIIQIASTFKVIPKELAKQIAWAYFAAGNSLLEQGKLETGGNADRLLARAIEKFEASCRIDPRAFESLNNWSNVLMERANRQPSDDALKTLALAAEKLRTALAIVPESERIFNNLGRALSLQAVRVSGPEADALFQQAIVQFEASLRINPQYSNTLISWGNALFNWANQKEGGESDRLYSLAIKKYESGLQIEPKNHQAHSNLGRVYLALAQKRPGGMDVDLLIQAGQKFEASFLLKADDAENLDLWGRTLAYLGRLKAGQEGEHLLVQSCEKFEMALQLRPVLPWALANWATALLDRTEGKSAEEAEPLLSMSVEKFETAARLLPGISSVINNFRIALQHLAKLKPPEEAARLLKKADSYPATN